ncbi:O-antigen ligase family protein [Aquifex pyrophilus]
MKEYKLWLLISLTLSAFVSISIFEGFVILTLLLALYNLIFKRNFTGSLRIGVSLYTFSTLLSTALYYPPRFLKSVEEGLFQFLYFLKIDKENANKFSRLFPYLMIIIGLVLLPVVLYNFYERKDPKPLWGGSFETGFFFTLFSLTSLTLFIQKRRFSFFLLFLLFIGIVFLSHRRSMILALLVMFYITLIILLRSKIISKKVFIAFNVVFLFSFIGGYTYLSMTDHRFRLLNEIFLGKRKPDYNTLNAISSARLGILRDGIEIIKEDIKEKRVLNLLIGHGVRAGEYMKHKYGAKVHRYESIFVVSEFIERGFLGVLGILLIYFNYFRYMLSFRIRREEDYYTLILAIPLGIHLVQTIFTFFWDALLPLYLVLFRVSEVSREEPQR